MTRMASGARFRVFGRSSRISRRGSSFRSARFSEHTTCCKSRKISAQTMRSTGSIRPKSNAENRPIRYNRDVVRSLRCSPSETAVCAYSVECMQWVRARRNWAMWRTQHHFSLRGSSRHRRDGRLRTDRPLFSFLSGKRALSNFVQNPMPLQHA